MSVDSQFSDLPEELKLKIFGYLDYSTIRRICPYVNQEFQQLSADFTLFQNYTQSKYDTDGGMKAALELRDELYLNHLQKLTVTSACLYNIEHLKFVRLEKLILKCNSYHEGIGGFLKNPSTLKTVELCGDVLPQVVEPNLVPYVTAVDTLEIQCNDDVKLIPKMPPKRILFDLEYMSMETIQEVLQLEEINDIISSNNVKIELKINGTIPSAVFNINVLYGKFESFIRKHLVHFSWRMRSESDWKVIVKICELCTSLEELLLDVFPLSENAPAIRSLASTNLQRLHLTERGSSAKEGIWDNYSILMNNVRDSLCLSYFPCITFSPTMIRTSCLSLLNCSITSELYLQLPDCLEELELINCSLSTKFKGSPRASRLNLLSLMNCSFETMRETLLALRAQKLKLTHQFLECGQVVKQLTHMNFDNIPVIELSLHIRKDVNFILQRLLASMPQVSVLKIEVFHGLISKNTFKLLSQFTKFQLISISEELNYREDVQPCVRKKHIRRFFPTAIIKFSSETICSKFHKYNIFL